MVANQNAANSTRVSFVILVLVVAYIVTYCALLNPVVVANEVHLGMIIEGCREPDYRAGGDFARVFFRPANWMDQHIRPAYWADASDFPNK
jgi:hypothetical protein